jgi:M6 family metalloprotease-like protein
MRVIRHLYVILFFLLIVNSYINAQIVSRDSIRILAVRVEFEEDNAPTTTGNGKFDLSSPSGIYQIDPPPHNRSYFQDHLTFLQNYFLKVSAEQLYTFGDVYPIPENEAYQLDEPMTSYNPNLTPDENNEGLARLFRDAILKADQDPNITFNEYQSYIVFHAGVGKDIDLGFDETPQDISSLFITSEFLQKYLSIPGIPVDNGTHLVTEGIIAPETESQVGIELGLNGILTSNFGSQLGWLDLFSPVTRRSGIGRFGLMDAGLFNGDGLLPALPCAWTRIDGAFEEPINIYYASGDEFQIYSTLSSNTEKIYRLPINEHEYFLIENRYAGELSLDSLQFELSQGRTEFATMKEVLLTYLPDKVEFSPQGVLVDVDNPDRGLPGSGCLIWHIDEAIIEENRNENRINADPDHRGVNLEEADGSQDIGQEYDFLSGGFGSEIGYLLDLWFAGNSSPIFTNEFGPTSIPNSRSYYNRANSHIKISEFSGPDSVMSFRVNLNILQQNFPVSIDPATYGKVTTLKTSDLDGDGKWDLILTTDLGNILVIDERGYSSWSSDSLMVANLPDPINFPPVIFNQPELSPARSKGMVILSQTGSIYGRKFGTSGNVDTLFASFRIGGMITTHPVAYYLADSSVNVTWGSNEGWIYTMHIDAGTTQIDSTQVTQEAIIYLHVNTENQIITISESGMVYRNSEFLKESKVPNATPVGDQAVGVTSEGNFLLFETEIGSFAEDGLYHFDSPMITHPFRKSQNQKPQYFVLGNNRVFCFNYNFSSSDDFPLRVFDPDRALQLPLSPLLNQFFISGNTENYGLIVTDPTGLVDGFDLFGKRLVDFPLAAGDSVNVTPVLLDLDTDGDLEIAAMTAGGILYVWDLLSSFQPYGWNQSYYDELNSNRNNNPLTQDPINPSQEAGGPGLLPENRVYNWPNPNIDNFTFIRYYLTDAAQVSIKIFDLAGDLVDEFPGPGNANTANQIKWDLNNVQSGVYLARIEAQNSNHNEVRIIKIAVVK